MIVNIKDLADIEQYISQMEIPRGDFSEFDIQAIAPTVKVLQPNDVVVEIGVRFGKSLTAVALLAQEGVKIFGIDNDDLPGRKEYWERSGLDKVATYILKDSLLCAQQWTIPIKLLHIDGDHTYEGVTADILAWTPFVVSGGSVFFHDCDSTSPGVVSAVKEWVERTPSLIVNNFSQIYGRTSLVEVRIP